MQNEKQIDMKNTQKEIVALRTENAILKETLSELQQQMNWLKKQMFGRKSEKTEGILMNGEQLSLFPEVHANETEKAQKTIKVSGHTKKAKRKHDDWMTCLPVEEIVHEVEDRICEKCVEEMQPSGKKKMYDELVYTPAKFRIKRHYAETLKCAKCGSDESQDSELKDIEACHFRTAKVPAPLFTKSYCSAELLAHIIYAKYVNAMPLYPQERDYAAKGAPISRETMSNWLIAASKEW